jgi:hypothetical protein
MRMPRVALCSLLVALSVAGQLEPRQSQAQVVRPIRPAKISYCASIQWPGSGPNLPTLPPDVPKAYLCPGQNFHSEDGVYTALLRDNGEFIVARGDPRDPTNVVWRTGVTGNGEDYWVEINRAGFVAVEQFTPGQPLITLWKSNLQSANPGQYFLNLSDAGALTLKRGTPRDPGSLQWTNSVDDPIDVSRGGVEIKNIAYEFAHQRSEAPSETAGQAKLCVNNTLYPKQCTLNLTLDDAKIDNFTFTSDPALAAAYNSKTKIGVPGLVEGSDDWAVTGTVEISKGFSYKDSASKTISIPFTITVPAQTTYEARIVGLLVRATIPFTYSGLAAFESGKRASLVDVAGIYSGSDIGQFAVEIKCVQASRGCKSAIIKRLPIGKTAKGYEVVSSAGSN